MVVTRQRGHPSMSEHTDQRYASSSSISNRQQTVQYAESNDEEGELISLRQRRTRSTSKVVEMEEPSSLAANGNSDDDDDDYPSKRYNGNAMPRSSPVRDNDFDCKYQPPLVRHQQMDVDLMNKKKRDSVSHRRSLRSLGLEEEGSSGDEEDGIGALATSLRPRSSSRDGFPGMLLRRSSRKKKAMYSTLNVSTIEHAAMLPEEMEHVERITRQKSKKRNGVKPELRDLLIREGKNPEDASELSQPDIYSSIKSRRRRRPKRFFDDDMHNGSQDHDLSEDNLDVDQTEETGDKNEKDDNKHHEEDEEGDDEDDDEEEHGTRRKYSLRTKRAQPLRLVYENQQPPRQAPREIFDHLPAASVHRRRRRTRELAAQHSASPYQQRGRRTNSQGASSSGTTESDDDEAKFKRRKKKSMDKARNRCLPMNLSFNDLAKHGFANERRKIGSSLADVDPMNVDKSVMFTSVGGHQKHVRSLKEMVVFPLMYPEVFEKFHIHPPRGCLFYGPPGTGKTLMARALANECSTEGRKVAFFMRKGADCLSKWVGESERQLRLLFDQAYQMRPSIIFFDEIDGLAPVRSSRQDQIHSSIVSTLLGLMDGLDNRGEIIVIGATNRIDSIDPALRRPGRFDREFLFPLPDKKARRDILNIHTKKWSPPPGDDLLNDLAEKTVGYCGADIMALCAESALFALRRRYPQIYASSEKLKLNVNTIDIEATDFFKAMRNVVPTAQRSDASPGQALHATVKPLLLNTLHGAVSQLANLFPTVHKKSKILKSNTPNDNPNTSSSVTHMSDSESDMEDDNSQSIIPLSLNGLVIPQSLLSGLSTYAYRDSIVHRPRLLVCGERGDGQTSHLAPALLHDLEGIPVHLLDIPALYGTAARMPEEACSQIFREARRTSPSIIYIPNVPSWWESATSTVLHAFEALLMTLPASSPVALIATANCPYEDLSPDLSSLFCEDRKEVFVMRLPTEEERTVFFAPVFLRFAKNPPVNKFRKQMQRLEVLEKAPPPKVAELTEQEIEKIELEEESTMRSLRLFLRDVLTRLAQDRRFKVFLKPVDIEEVTDYTEVIDEPMDISTMMNKIDQHKYNNVASFVADINLICCNALEYNPDVCAEDKAIRHRACLLKDIATAIIQEELDPNFEKLCNEVTEARRKRNANPLKFAPSYFNVLPKAKQRQLQAEKQVEVNATVEDGKSSLEMQQDESELSKSHHAPPRKKRRRSTWASGVIRRAKKRIRIDDEDGADNNDQEEDDHEDDHDDDHEEEEDVSDEGKLGTEDEQDTSFKTLVENEETELPNNDVDIETKPPSSDLAIENDDENIKIVNKMGPAGDATTEAINIHKDFDEDKSLEEEQHNPTSTKEGPEKMETNSEITQIILKTEEVEEMKKSPAKQTQDTVEADSSMVETADENLDDCKEDVKNQEDEDTSMTRSRSSSILEDADENNHTEQPSLVADAEVEPMETSNDTSLNEKNNETEDLEEGHENTKLEAGESQKEPQTVCRMTLRSRNRSHKEDECATPTPPLPPPPPLIVDEQKLKDLLHFTVQATASFRVEDLERLYSALNRCIHRHRHDYDKTTLVQELTIEVMSSVKYVTKGNGSTSCQNRVV